MSKLEDTTVAFARTIEKLGTEEFIPALADTLCAFADADDATVIVYGYEEMPSSPLPGPSKESMKAP